VKCVFTGRSIAGCAGCAHRFYEKANSPALYKPIPEDYISRMVKAIVAFDIKVTSIEHVFKLSQNRDNRVLILSLPN